MSIEHNTTSTAMGEVESMNSMISLVSSLLERVAEFNDVNPPSSSFIPQKVSIFHGLARPPISIRSYLERIFKYANCSPSCLVLAYIYLDRFSRRHPLLPINSYSVHRFLITAVLLSAKFIDDMCYNNAYYAKIGGISTREMNYLEVELLFGLGFHLNVTPTTFQTYCFNLETQMFILEPPLHSSSSCLIMRKFKDNANSLLLQSRR